MAKGKHIVSGAKHAGHAMNSRGVAFAGAHAAAHASGAALVSKPSISIPRNLSIVFKMIAVGDRNRCDRHRRQPWFRVSWK